MDLLDKRQYQMNNDKTRFIGEEKFLWFFAEVININDQYKLGQCQIRIDGFHDELVDEDLPWAMPLLPITSASYQTPEFSEVGVSPTGIMVGSFVMGFFADGSEARVPVIMGTMPAVKDDDIEKHDVPKLAREINTWTSKPLLGPEPPSSYASKYPFNKVTRTQSGHVIELDDTPTAERIHIYHKSGTYVEISSDGKTVTKVAGDNYTILAKNDELFVQGDVNVIIKGNANIQIDGNLKTKVNGACDVEAGSELKISSPDPIVIQSGVSVSLVAPKVNYT